MNQFEGAILAPFKPMRWSITALGGVTCLGAVLLIAAYLLIVQSVEHLVRKDAEDTAQHWVTYFAAAIEDIDEIAAGQPPSKRSAEVLAELSQVATIFRFKIFDREGTLRLVSDEIVDSGGGTTALSVHNATAARVLQSGMAFTEVKEGTPPERPNLYAETYLPVRVGDETVAIAEVYLDQTAKRALYRQSTALTTLLVALSVAGAFVVPATAFVLRTRQKQRSDEMAEFLARHDALTALWDRNAFLGLVEAKCDRHPDGEKRFAVHSINLDRFKDVNDACGNETGDCIIREVGNRLRALVGPEDVVSRTGGDEFAIAQIEFSDRAEIELLATKILNELGARHFLINEDTVPVTASVGSAVFPDDGRDATQLLKRAELAVDKVKLDGGNAWCRFSADMDAELAKRRHLEELVRKAATECSFELHFQPQYDARNTRLTGFEALLRLPKGDASAVSPAEFVPFAERLGLINKIGAWVIGHACEVAAQWPDDLSVAVNLSAIQFEDGHLIKTVGDALRESGLPAKRLELEITESLILHNTDSVLRQIKELKEIGVSIAMDDFGVGYSSLAYLWRFPFDKLKIDKSFIMADHQTQNDVGKILRTIVSLGHSLKMQVTAEGIETASQVEFVRALSCDRLQGFYFGKPMPEAEIASTVIRDFASSLDRTTHKQVAIESASAS